MGYFTMIYLVQYGFNSPRVKGLRMIEYYLQFPENEPASRIDVDLSLADDDPEDMFKPMLLWVFVKMQSPDENGICTEDECSKLTKIREALAEKLSGELGAIFSGSRMCEGWFELYFYARTGKKLIASAGEVLQQFEGYTFDTGSSRDEAWEHYHNELYPDTVQLHQIQSRQIIAQLIEAGDDISVEREVEHYLFFQLPTQADRAVTALEASGYGLKEAVEQEGEYPYGRVMVKLQDVTESTMETATAEMLEAALSEHGLYEGWSTTVA
jgi:regulator of RNase E activity RraB